MNNVGWGGSSHRIGVCLRYDVRLGPLEADPCGQVGTEAPLDPNQGDPTPAVVGDRRIVDDLCARQKILVDGHEIGSSEVGPEPGDLLPALGGDPQIPRRCARHSARVAQRSAPPVLINNAANDQRYEFNQITPEQFDRMIAVNFRHVFFAAQAIVPQMRELG